MAVGEGLARDDEGLAALLRAGRALAAEIQIHPGRTADLPYHNLRHFAEATLAMARLCAEAQRMELISRRDAARGVVAMLGHDMDHDGLAEAPGVLEAQSAMKSASICRAAGVTAEDAAVIAYLIEGTSPAMEADNAARAAQRLPPGPFGSQCDLLSAMANEADIMASLLPATGVAMGEALAEEMVQAGGSAAIATFTARLAFLRRRTLYTPAAAALGLPAAVQRQIDGLAAIARDLKAGETADDGAAALDRMDRAPASALYHAAARAAAP
jgi:hypothetical protein